MGLSVFDGVRRSLACLDNDTVAHWLRLFAHVQTHV